MMIQLIVLKMVKGEYVWNILELSVIYDGVSDRNDRCLNIGS